MPRLRMTLLGFPLFEITTTTDDGGPAATAAVDPPTQAGVGSLADTALGDQSDPATVVTGFGKVLDPHRYDQDRGLR